MDKHITFTARQMDILRFLADGLNYKDIAEKFCIKLDTLRTNSVRSIKNKTGLSSMQELAEYAKRQLESEEA